MSARSPLETARYDRRDFYSDTEHAMEVFARLRAEDPVHWFEEGHFWVVTRHEDVREITNRPDLFSSAYGLTVGDAYGPDAVSALLPPRAAEQFASGELSPLEARRLVAQAKNNFGGEQAEQILVLDPPRHTELRRTVSRAFTPGAVAHLEAEVVRLADEAVERIVPGEVTDVVDVVYDIPALVIGAMMGVRPEDEPDIIRWVKAIVAVQDESDPGVQAATVEALAEYSQFIAEMIEFRRSHPGGDMISRLLEADVDGEKLSEANLVMFAATLLGAGVETTMNAIAGGVMWLARNPDQLDVLRRDPDLLHNAVDEILRVVSPVWSTARTATTPVTLRDRSIGEGDFVVMIYPSANRDESVWEHPDTFDVTRPFNPMHVAFGWGRHLCLGAALARQEIRVTFEKMIARFAGWEMAGEPERIVSTQVNGFDRMPVRFHE